MFFQSHTSQLCRPGGTGAQVATLAKSAPLRRDFMWRRGASSISNLLAATTLLSSKEQKISPANNNVGTNCQNDTIPAVYLPQMKEAGF